ncbi:MAG: ABC transporter substrate-binding protein, partial [Halobacteriaceae archaeon]
LASLAGCIGGGGGGEEGPIKLGGVLPLTGIQAEPAKWIKRAWELKIEQVNDNGGLFGRDVDLIVYDNELTASKTQRQTQRLLTKNNVDILLGPYNTVTMPTMAPIAESHGYTVLHMFWPASHILDWKQGNGKWPHQFGFSAGSYTYPRATLKFLSSLPSDIRPKRLAFIGRNDVYGKDGFSSWQRFLDEFGGNFEIVGNEYYQPGTTDLSSVVRKFQGENVDFFGSNSYFGGSSLFVRALANLGMQPDITWTSVGSQIPDWIPSMGATGEYVMGAGPYVYSVDTEANQKLYETTQNKWGQKPHYSLGFAAIQFDAYLQALKEIGDSSAFNTSIVIPANSHLRTASQMLKCL